MNRPIEQCYWIVPGRFLAGEYPRNVDERSSPEKIDALLRAGVTTFIDLTEESELHPYSGLMGTGASHRRFPIRDRSVPKSLEATVAILDTIDRRALGSNHCCKPPLWIRREGKRRTDLLLLGYHATFGIIRIASRRKGVAMMPNRTAGTSPVVQCGRMKLCCNRCTSRVRCSASAFLA